MSMIIANMVIRNEADKYLPQVLERLSDQVDLIIVTDDASDDDTVEVALSYDKVRLQQMNQPTFSVHEGHLRQTSWNWLSQHVTHPDDTVILAIDADEELYILGSSFEELAGLKQFEVFGIQFCHMWNETQFRVDKGWRPNISTRMFRYHPGGQFQNKQLACGSEPTYVLEYLRQYKFLPNTGLVMKHLSYIKDEDKLDKYNRYMAIDQGNFHALQHIQSIVDPVEETTLVDWTW